jgi:hypothetical protein
MNGETNRNMREMDEVASDLVAAFEIALEGELQAVVQPAIASAVASFCESTSLQEVLARTFQ